MSETGITRRSAALRLVPPADFCADESRLQLELPARPESVRVLRGMAAAVAVAVGAPPALLDDLRLAVTEAAANVVIHAYRHLAQPGSIELEMWCARDELRVAVRDRGLGPDPRLDSCGLGLGVGLMGSVSDGCRIARRAGGGTEVELRFCGAGERRAAGA
jgi:serine/threonine-protein kinase RsbW